MEIKCDCGRLIGIERFGKLYNRRNEIIAETEISGYCVGCKAHNIWRSSGLLTQEEVEIPPVPVIEVTQAVTKDLLKTETEKVRTPPSVAKPTTQIVQPVSIEKSNKPMFVVFGDSKIYHSRNHFENKTEVAKIITDTTGYRLCKICDGFVEAENE